MGRRARFLGCGVVSWRILEQMRLHRMKDVVSNIKDPRLHLYRLRDAIAAATNLEDLHRSEHNNNNLKSLHFNSEISTAAIKMACEVLDVANS